MSKYTTLKNKQRLAKALDEMGMTVDEAKQWLAEATDQQAKQTSRCFNTKSKPSGKSCFPDTSLDDQLAFAFWFKEHEDAYAETKAAEKCSLDAEKPTTPQGNKSSKSNVTFVPGDSHNESLLFVGGTQVQGDFKACYTYDSASGKATLQVEFADLL
jgi:hypothetical protein